MGIDIEALKARLNKMNNRGGGGNRPSNLWKPDLGKYEVRIVPWPDTVKTETPPFVERWHYWDLGRGLIAPALTEPDPVRELRASLFEERTESNLAMARKMRPKMRAYLAVLVRGQEEEGVKIWGISQTVYKQLIEYIIDPDYGDISDIEQGRDLKISISDSGKKFDDGRPIKDTTIGIKPHPSPLAADAGAIKTAIESVPNIDEIYSISTYEELAQALDRFIGGPPTGAPQTRGGGDSGATPAPKTQGLDAQFDELLNV